MVDDELTDCGIVMPGMGDVGDRLFGTGNHDFEESMIEAPVVAAASSSAASATSEESAGGRRKRSASLSLEMEHTAKK